MARWNPGDAHVATWRDNVVALFDEYHLVPKSDIANDCCFICVSDSLIDSHYVSGTSWGDRIGDTEEEWEAFSEKVFLAYPLTLQLTCPLIHLPYVSLAHSPIYTLTH